MVTERSPNAATGPQRLLFWLQIGVVLVIFIAPVAWMVMSSFKDRTEVTAYPPTLIFDATLDNYVRLLEDDPFLAYTLNSVIVAGGSTLLGLLLALPAAFALSWHRVSWPATLTLFARMAPGTLFLLPWFIMFTELGMLGSYWVLILTHCVITMPIALWSLLPTFDAVPRTLVEAARMDGCRSLTILVRIMMPLIGPGLVVATILSFVFSWNYFLFALVLSDFDSRTLIVASFNFIGEGATDWGRLMAAATLIALPPLILAMIIQRRLVAGLNMGAVKG